MRRFSCAAGLKAARPHQLPAAARSRGAAAPANGGVGEVRLSLQAHAVSYQGCMLERMLRPYFSPHTTPHQPCWHCHFYERLLHAGSAAACTMPRAPRVRSAPEHGCSGWEREPGTDDEAGSPEGDTSERRSKLSLNPRPATASAVGVVHGQGSWAMPWRGSRGVHLSPRPVVPGRQAPGEPA